MTPRACCAILAAIWLGACASEAPLGGTPELAKACAVRPCRCLSDTVPFFLVRKSAPVQWRENGDAYCPEGYSLALSDGK